MNKPIKFFFFVLAFMGLFLTSCQKVKTELDTKPGEERNLEPNQQSADKAKILHFIEKIKADRSATDISDRDAPLMVDELAFGSESVLNLYYTRLDDRFKDIDYAEVQLTVPVTNGVVNNGDLATAYSSIEQTVENHLSTVPYSNKKVGYVDVIVSEVTANEATIRVKTAVGDLEVGPSDPNDPVAQPPYFDADDDWRCGPFVFNGVTIEAKGKCDGTSPDLDAAKLLKNTLNSQFRLDHPFPVFVHGRWGFQVNSDVHFLLFDMDNTSNRFFKGLYDANDVNLDNLCITSSNMNLFYGNYENEIAEMETTTWQLDNPGYFPQPQQGESGWKFKWVTDLRAQNLPEYLVPNMIKHRADLLFMKQIIIYDDGGSNIGVSNSSSDPITWVNDLLD